MSSRSKSSDELSEISSSATSLYSLSSSSSPWPLSSGIALVASVLWPRMPLPASNVDDALEPTCDGVPAAAVACVGGRTGLCCGDLGMLVTPGGAKWPNRMLLYLSTSSAMGLRSNTASIPSLGIVSDGVNSGATDLAVAPHARPKCKLNVFRDGIHRKACMQLLDARELLDGNIFRHLSKQALVHSHGVVFVSGVQGFAQQRLRRSRHGHNHSEIATAGHCKDADGQTANA